jgi:hypothetical protein
MSYLFSPCVASTGDTFDSPVSSRRTAASGRENDGLFKRLLPFQRLVPVTHRMLHNRGEWRGISVDERALLPTIGYEAIGG